MVISGKNRKMGNNLQISNQTTSKIRSNKMKLYAYFLFIVPLTDSALEEELEKYLFSDSHSQSNEGDDSESNNSSFALEEELEKYLFTESLSQSSNKGDDSDFNKLYTMLRDKDKSESSNSGSGKSKDPADTLISPKSKGKETFTFASGIKKKSHAESGASSSYKRNRSTTRHYECEWCGIRFDNNLAKKNHKQEKHEGVTAPARIPCTVKACPVMVRINDMDRHLNTHFPQKYFCCDVPFRSKDCMRRHKKKNHY